MHIDFISKQHLRKVLQKKKWKNFKYIVSGAVRVLVAATQACQLKVMLFKNHGLAQEHAKADMPIGNDGILKQRLERLY